MCKECLKCAAYGLTCTDKFLSFERVLFIKGVRVYIDVPIKDCPVLNETETEREQYAKKHVANATEIISMYREDYDRDE